MLIKNILVSTIIFLVSILRPFAVQAAEQAPVKIGVMLSLSGDYAYIGTEMRRGIELAQAEAPPGLVELIFEDDKTLNKTESVKALKKLLDVDQVQAVLNMSVNSMPALYPILKERKIPAVVVWDDNDLLRTMSPYAFSMGYYNEGTGRSLAEFVFNKLGKKKAAVVSALDQWSEILSDAFIKRFKEIGGIVVFHEKVNPELSDFRSLISKIKQKQIGVVYFPLVLNRGVFIKQSRQLGYQGALLSTELTESEVVNASKAANGVYSAQVWLENQAFASRYKARYGPIKDAEALGFADYGYDSLKLVIEAVKLLRRQTGETPPKTLVEALQKVRGSGLANTLAIMQIKDQKFTCLSSDVER